MNIKNIALIMIICMGHYCANADVYSALEYVYDSNPTIAAARSDVKSARAQLSGARTGYKPYLGLSANAGVAHTDLRSDNALIDNMVGDGTTYHPMGIGLQFQQNLFSGFSTIAQVKGAKANMRAQDAMLNTTEQNVFLGAINAYINVLVSRDVLELTRGNEKVLSEYHKSIMNRQRVGQLTKTDVATAAARLESAKYQVIDAQSKYDNAMESVERIFGTTDIDFVDIDTTKMDKYFPDSLEVAEEYAINNHPAIVALAQSRDAARENIVVARKSMLPSVDVRASLMQVNDMPYVDRVRDGRIGVYLSVPLFDKGGAFAATDRVRATVAGIEGKQLETRLSIIENLRVAWNMYNAQSAAISAARSGVEAAQMALGGIRDEQSRGRRTVLDVLNAEQELLNARVTLLRAEHAKQSAYFAVIAAMGKLTPQALGLD